MKMKIMALAIVALVIASGFVQASVGLLVLKAGPKEIQAYPGQIVPLKLLITNLGTRQLAIRLNVTSFPKEWFVSPQAGAFLLKPQNEESSDRLLAAGNSYVKIEEYEIRASIPFDTSPGNYKVKVSLLASPSSVAGIGLEQEREMEFAVRVSQPPREEEKGIVERLIGLIPDSITGLLSGSGSGTNIMIILLAVLVAVYLYMRTGGKKRNRKGKKGGREW